MTRFLDRNGLKHISILAAVLSLLLPAARASAQTAPHDPSLPPPTRTDASRWVGGVPLGGLGTGTVELRGDGSFRAWQIFNDWGNAQTCSTLHDYDLLNAFAAVKINGTPYMLETAPPPGLGLTGVPGITYDGLFPFASLKYQFPTGAPVTGSLVAFGSYIPRDDNDSGIPAIGLAYSFTNLTASPVKISLALSAVNPFGNHCDVVRSGSSSIVESVDTIPDASRGYTGVALAALDAVPTSITGGDDNAGTLQSFWASFSGASGQYPSAAPGGRIAQVITFTVPANQTVSERFVLGWYDPFHWEDNNNKTYVGNKYQNWINSAAGAVQLFAGKFDFLRSKSLAWVTTMTNSTWPRWAVDWLVNNQSSIVKSSWWTQNGDFMCYESTECPDSSPIHLTDLADWPIVDEFPDIELNLLSRESSFQYPTGQMPEQFSSNGGGAAPSATYMGGRNLYDIEPKYVVEVYHRWRETGNRAFLDAMFPSVKKAIMWCPTFDEMKTGFDLPTGSNIWSTWDHWDNAYFPIYGATVTMEGYRAAEALADVEGDTAFAAQMQTMYETGLAATNKYLWNGEFYAFTTDSNLRQDNISFCESTYGDDEARFIGLGGVIPDDRALSTLRAVAKYNSQPTRYGIVVTADTSGKMIEYDNDVRAQVTTCHEMPTPIALIEEGDSADIQTGLNLLAKVNSLSDLYPGALWNLPHHVVAATGARNVRDFPHYLRDRALWALLKVLNGWVYDAPDQSVSLGPVLTPEDSRGPWICSKAYGTLSQKITGSRQMVTLRDLDGSLILKRIIVRCRTGTVAAASVVLDGQRQPCSAAQTGNQVTVTLLRPMTIQAGSEAQINFTGDTSYIPDTANAPVNN